MAVIQHIISYLNKPLNDEEKSFYNKMKLSLDNIIEANFISYNKSSFKNSNRNNFKNVKYNRQSNNIKQDFSRDTRDKRTFNTGGGFIRGIHTSTPKKNKYLSMYKKVSKDEYEKHYNDIENKFGKITNSNYDIMIKDIQSSLTKLDTTNTIKFVKNIFNRSASQPLFCKIYVNVLADCIGIQKDIAKYINEIIDEYLELFNKTINCISPDNYDEFCDMNKEKEYRIGYSLFISELYKRNIISDDIIYMFSNSIFSMIIKQTNLEFSKNNKENIQDNIGCFKNLVSNYIKNNNNTEYSTNITDSITKYLNIDKKVLRNKIGMKSVFMLEDILKMK